MSSRSSPAEEGLGVLPLVSLGYGAKSHSSSWPEQTSLLVSSCPYPPSVPEWHWAGWLALGALVLHLWPPLRGCQDDHPLHCRPRNDLPLPQVVAEREKKENRLQLARETDLLVPISPPGTPACPLPSIKACTQGLGISQKSQAAFQGLGVRGGGVSQPGWVQPL